MDDFDYQAPTSIEQAVALLSGYSGEARVLAGGTDLIVQLRERQRQAGLLVDVKRIAAMTTIEYSPERGLSIGAATPCYRIYEHPAVAQHYSGLIDAAHIIGGWQIQSRASLGGNLCNASPAADSIPQLIAYQAICQVTGPTGTRSVPVESFCTAPGKTVLKKGELLTAITLPPQPPHSGGHYLRFIPRNEMDIAVVGAGAWIQLDEAEKTIVAARIGLGAVAPTPLFAEMVGTWLAGQQPVSATFEEAAELAKQQIQPISDMRGPARHRAHLVGVMTRRALAGATARALGMDIENGHLPFVYDERPRA